MHSKDVVNAFLGRSPVDFQSLPEDRLGRNTENYLERPKTRPIG